MGSPESAFHGWNGSRKLLSPGGKNAHYPAMTKLLEQAVETVRGLPPEMQDDLARMLLRLAGGDQGVFQLSAEEQSSFDESLAQADRGEFATEAEIVIHGVRHGARRPSTASK
jgi:hypothetical protein